MRLHCYYWTVRIYNWHQWSWPKFSRSIWIRMYNIYIGPFWIAIEY